MDDEWYEPLRRPRRESASSSSEDAGSYEDMIKIDKYEDSQASTPRADKITQSRLHKTSGANGDSTPTHPPKQVEQLVNPPLLSPVK
ncbi:hypothetical protein OS493_014118 [Desmophyllum pertusum]|uniref:Uncharacterized protein n=1 Tax=Desmophyllum pertusum TaxID=174260 RepID=A0A9W9ZDI7_9CNID|nr:hypothetical protein OS493_014118 [Desmophyllum pertusum]